METRRWMSGVHRATSLPRLSARFARLLSAGVELTPATASFDVVTPGGNCDTAVIRRPSRTSRDAQFVFRFWSGARDLNPGPHGPEPCALPNCASPRLDRSYDSDGPGDSTGR